MYDESDINFGLGRFVREVQTSYRQVGQNKCVFLSEQIKYPYT